MDESQTRTIRENPIGHGLDAFRASFASTPDTLDKLGPQELRNLALHLLPSLQIHSVAGLLPSKGGRGTLQSDLLRLPLSLGSDDFDLDRIKPLLRAALTDKLDDLVIWQRVYDAITEPTTPPRSIVSSSLQTPWLCSTGSFANSSEYRKDVDRVLKEELGAMYVGLPGFYETFFGRVPGLEAARDAVYNKCIESGGYLFDGGWSGWPEDADQDRVLEWFSGLSDKFWELSAEQKSTVAPRRRPLAQPNKPIQGSTAERKLDIGFVNDPDANKDSRCHWSKVLVPGELKSNPSADTASKAWLDIGRYAREVLAAQDTRRFVLGFTLCGPLMRLWLFDRLGGIASPRFDINKEPAKFVYTILGFLWMTDEHLGFDPTIRSSDGRRYIDIERNGQTERIVIDALIQRTPCVAGRATTCWRAHRDGDSTPLVIKDSWQYPERGEEGELLHEATAHGVEHVARYYHHETVRVRGQDDDIKSNIRAELDITEAVNYSPMPPPTAAASQRPGRPTSHNRRKRSSSRTDASLPPRKRSRSTAPATSTVATPTNRVHRRLILRDCGKPIYKASSRVALLRGFEGCIEGHRSLRTKSGILQRDISINNLMVNENADNPSWSSFLIDLDLAIKEDRGGVSGARGMTGTRAFMAIGVLLGEKHSFMHDLESFFWVLFWICIHYDGAEGRGRVIPRFDKWNYADNQELAALKKGLVSDERDFLDIAEKDFTPYYHSLIPWINRLRKVVFPHGRRWVKEVPRLYDGMKDILHEAQEDPEVLTER